MILCRSPETAAEISSAVKRKNAMKHLKRFTAALLALCTTLSLFSFVGCGGNDSPATKTECDRKGHEYSEDDGKCIRCDKQAVIPAIPSKQKYPLVEPCPHDGGYCGCEYQGSGYEYSRVELKETCYTIEIESRGEIWVSFSVEQAGQYVLYSVDGDKGVKVERYNANGQYVPPVGKAAIEKDGNFYSYVNCGEGYFNPEWRATYRLTGDPETQVKVCFVRVDGPAWEPKSVYTQITPTQINGKKAEDKPGMKLIDVPYDSDYFYDESVGYYRMGTKETPGEIIYVAIDRPADRMFEGAKFTSILKDAGMALNVNVGLTEDDDFDVHCYTNFIMDWADENAIWSTTRPVDPDPNPDGNQNPNLVTGKPDNEPDGDKTKNCYENFCNSDGVYPVNQELHTFLTLYTKAHPPINGTTLSENLWLAPCYYYSEVPSGTEDNPILLTEGEQELTVKKYGKIYCSLQGEGSYVITCSSGNVQIKVDTSFVDLTELEVTAPLVFQFKTKDNEAETFTITVTKAS